MNDETRLDNELAAFTDRLLAGEDAQAAPEIDALAQVVRQFHHVMDPASKPGPAFRERLAERLDQEWAAMQQDHPAIPMRESARESLIARRSEPKSRPIFAGLRRNRTVRLAAMAATVAVALFVAILIAADPGNTSETGTASGEFGWPVIIGIVVVGLLGLLVFWLGQRSKS
jgi:hypothetical protein